MALSWSGLRTTGGWREMEGIEGRMVKVGLSKGASKEREEDDFRGKKEKKRNKVRANCLMEFGWRGDAVGQSDV